MNKITIIDEYSSVDPAKFEDLRKPSKLFGMKNEGYIAPFGTTIVTVDLIWEQLESDVPMTSLIYTNGCTNEPINLGNEMFRKYLVQQQAVHAEDQDYWDWSATVLMLELCVQGEEL